MEVLSKRQGITMATHGSNDGPVALNQTCSDCGSTEFVMKNYSMAWHDGDIHCAGCDKFIRYFDAG